jgi:membrane protein implicated in regulation of membrane protease activity
LNTATAMLLFFLGSLALVIGFVRTPSIQFYTGGVVIALLIIGLLYIYGNSVRQTMRMEKQLKKEQEDAVAAAKAAPTSSSS